VAAKQVHDVALGNIHSEVQKFLDYVFKKWRHMRNLMFVVLYILVTYMFNSSPTRCTLYSLFLSWCQLYMFRVLYAPISSSTDAVYGHRFCMAWCAIPLEQVLVLGHLYTWAWTVTDKCKGVPKTSTCSNGITHQTIQNLWPYTAVVLLMMGANST
jgi:hypothetical protein